MKEECEGIVPPRSDDTPWKPSYKIISHEVFDCLTFSNEQERNIDVMNALEVAGVKEIHWRIEICFRRVMGHMQPLATCDPSYKDVNAAFATITGRIIHPVHKVSGIPGLGIKALARNLNIKQNIQDSENNTLHLTFQIRHPSRSASVETDECFTIYIPNALTKNLKAFNATDNHYSGWRKQ